MYFPKKKRHVQSVDDFKRVLTSKEKEQILQLAKNDESYSYLFFKLLFYFGDRFSNIRYIKISDIDFDNNKLRSLICKSHKRLYRGFNEEIRNLLLEHVEEFALEIGLADGYLFFGMNKTRGKHISANYFFKRFAKYREQLGLDKLYFVDRSNKRRFDVRTHTARATKINKLLEHGFTRDEIAQYLGYKHTYSLDPYIKNFDLKAIDKKVMQIEEVEKRIGQWKSEGIVK